MTHYLNLSADEQSALIDHCKELVRKAGGTIREDMSQGVYLILDTRRSARNPKMIGNFSRVETRSHDI
jgi:hypothetical protein